MTEKVSYEDRYCLFLDILGFQSHVEESVADNPNSKKLMTFGKLKSVLKRISDGVNYRQGIEVNGQTQLSSRCVTQFSDSVVISYLKKELNGSGVSSILNDVHRLQLDLMRSGVLLRGAISSGPLFHDSDFVFGPALNEAVALEKLANYPRVIVDGQILNEAGLKPSAKSMKPSGWARDSGSLVTGDFDGLYYVDYFNAHPQDFDEEWTALFEYLESLRGVVRGLANKKDPSLKVKHSWLRTKFNAMIGPLEKSGFKEIGGISVPSEDTHLFQKLKSF